MAEKNGGKEKKKANYNSEFLEKRRGNTHNDPTIAMQIPQSQSVSSPAFAKV
jgi:hypothetical protein